MFDHLWMVISDGSKKLRMSFKDEAFTVPMKLQGQVLVEGAPQAIKADERVKRAYLGNMITGGR